MKNRPALDAVSSTLQMRKLSRFCLIILIASLQGLSANELFKSFQRQAETMRKVAQVKVDNQYVQSYRGELGVWKDSHSYSYYAKKFGVTVAKIKKVNGFSRRSNRRYVFYPYSKEYISKLRDIDVIRKEWQVPVAEFLWPVKGNRITSRPGKRWGKSHTGIDIAAGRKSIVVAAQDGVAIRTGYNGAFGVVVELRHGNGYTSLYGHLTTALVKEGDTIKKGQIIGLSGNTGRSTGPHLHFEVRCNGVALNAEFFLPEFDEFMQDKVDFHTDLRMKKREINKL